MPERIMRGPFSLPELRRRDCRLGLCKMCLLLPSTCNEKNDTVLQEEETPFFRPKTNREFIKNFSKTIVALNAC